MSQASITSIQDMLAPAVLTTGIALLSSGIHTQYSAANDRIRAMTAEMLALLTDSDGGLLTRDQLGGVAAVRSNEIDVELPVLRDRQRALHNALQFIYGAFSLLVISMILIAIDITVPAPAAGTVALVAVLLVTVALLAALALALLSVRQSIKAADYEVGHTLELGWRQRS